MIEWQKTHAIAPLRARLFNNYLAVNKASPEKSQPSSFFLLSYMIKGSTESALFCYILE
jgi:hypothetical protein